MRQIPHIGLTAIAAILIAADQVGAAQNAEEIYEPGRNTLVAGIDQASEAATSPGSAGSRE